MAELSVERVSFEQALLNLLDAYGIEGGTGVTGTILPTRLSLINATKVKLDEMIPEGEGVVYDLEDTPNVSDPYDLLINAILNEAAKRVLMNCPKHYLDPVEATTPVKQVDTITLTGTIGTANITGSGGLTKLATYATSLTVTASNFVTAWAADYLAQGIVLTSSGVYLIFTAQTAGTAFVSPVITNATSNLAGTVVNTTANVSETVAVQIGTSKIGYIVLPANFLRFISLKMADWMQPVTEVLETGTEEYRMQFNPYVRGGVAKPKAAIAHRTISGVQRRVIEYFSVNYSHVIDWLFYIQETEAESVQQNLWDALTWASAAMVLQIIEKPELSAIAFKRELESYVKATT